MATGGTIDHRSQHALRLSDISQEPLKMLTPLIGHMDKPIVSLEKAVESLSSIVPEVQSHAKTAKLRCPKPPADGLTVDESASIMLYTMSWKPYDKCLQFVLNTALRSEDRTQLEPWHLYLKLILTALNRLPSVQQTVYRGNKNNMLKDYRKGKSFVWWGFSSCTISVDILRSEVFLGTTVSRTIFATECKSGKDIRNHSFYPTEDEILILPATEFKVLDFVDHGQGLQMIHLKETVSYTSLQQLAHAADTTANSTSQPNSGNDSDDSTDNDDIIVWIDSSNDATDSNFCKTVTRLQRVVEKIYTFTDPDKCVELLTKSSDKNTFMIVSGAFGQNLVPIIHDLSQINSIFVFCGNKAFHQQWAKNWSKIKGVFTEIGDLCTAVERFVEQDETPISSSVTATNGGTAKNNLNKLDPTLMYTQILKEIILQIHFDDEHIKDFITYCRQQFVGNDYELTNCDKVEKEYHEHTPIWWYTSNCFLHPMLNRALRAMDVGLIIKMGFFIQDLLRQIDQLHSKQFDGDQHPNAFIVYRGQGMSKTDFSHLMKVKGGLLSFNNFLSTSKNRGTSLAFAESAQDNPESIGILFVMTINPSISSTSFAAIRDVSYFHDSDDEVLFSMHTIFRVGDIKQLGENNRLIQVNLVLTDDDDRQLRTLTQHIQSEIEGPTAWHRLGNALLKLGQFDKAEEVYNILLSQKNDNHNISILYDQLGSVKNSKGEYKEAITFYEKALEIRQKTLPASHPFLAQSYSNIGVVQGNIEEHAKSLASHEKALKIRQKTLPAKHADIADSYNNIGAIYEKMGDHPKALSFHEQALDIRQSTLPPNHPSFAQSYNNMGLVYLNMKQYQKALSFFEKALELRQETLPPNHPDVADSYNNIGSVYENMHDHSKAVCFYERAVEIGERSLSPNHPILQQWQKKLESMETNRE